MPRVTTPGGTTLKPPEPLPNPFRVATAEVDHPRAEEIDPNPLAGSTLPSSQTSSSVPPPPSTGAAALPVDDRPERVRLARAALRGYLQLPLRWIRRPPLTESELDELAESVVDVGLPEWLWHPVARLTGVVLQIVAARVQPIPRPEDKTVNATEPLKTSATPPPA